MNSLATTRFWELFSALPSGVQRLAVKNYHLWRRDPNHPSLHFRRLQGTADRFTVRVGEHHRVIGRRTGDTITWVWIGSHSEYNRVVGS